VFKDFGIDMGDAADLEFLLKARQAGEISQTTFLKEIKRRGLLSEDFNAQTEIDLLDIESAGSATSEDALGIEDQADKEPEHAGRNKVGDYTSEENGHRHVLEEGGMTSTDADESGVAHQHEWTDMGIRSSVDEGHSHVLLTRSAQTKAPPPAIPPPMPGEEEPEEPGKVLPFGKKAPVDDKPVPEV
jgi:hypothetical protein